MARRPCAAWANAEVPSAGTPALMIIHQLTGISGDQPRNPSARAGGILAAAPAIQTIGPHGTVVAAGASYLSRSLEDLGVL
jgi:hypothetical protein